LYGEARQLETYWTDDGVPRHPMTVLGKAAGLFHRGSRFDGTHTRTPDAVGLAVVESMCAEGRPLEQEVLQGETTFTNQSSNVDRVSSWLTVIAPENQSAPRDRPDAALVWNESAGEIGRC
jgi:hypothetical protein